MTPPKFLLAVCAVVCPTLASDGGLHIITGAPYSQGNAVYPSALFRLNADRTLAKVEEITEPTSGTEWIGVSYDAQKAVFLGSWEKEVVVLDFLKAEIVKRCPLPGRNPTKFYQSWLILPPDGLAFEWEQAGDTLPDFTIHRMMLDGKLPCENSFLTAQPESVRQIVAHGAPGIADIVNRDGIGVFFNDGLAGTMKVGFPRHFVELDVRVPPEVIGASKVVGGAIFVSDSRCLVLGVGRSDNWLGFVLYNKEAKRWRQLPPGFGPHVRGFGRYLASAQADRSPTSKARPSAGSDKWPEGRDGVRPDLRERLAEMPGVSYPGILKLYDIETDRVLSINTGQGDSEVLLVEGGVAYYRVADELYAATIEENKLGEPRRLVTDDRIRDAHWAFIKH